MVINLLQHFRVRMIKQRVNWAVKLLDTCAASFLKVNGIELVLCFSCEFFHVVCSCKSVTCSGSILCQMFVLCYSLAILTLSIPQLMIVNTLWKVVVVFVCLELFFFFSFLYGLSHSFPTCGKQRWWSCGGFSVFWPDHKLAYSFQNVGVF